MEVTDALEEEPLPDAAPFPDVAAVQEPLPPERSPLPVGELGAVIPEVLGASTDEVRDPVFAHLLPPPSEAEAMGAGSATTQLMDRVGRELGEDPAGFLQEHGRNGTYLMKNGEKDPTLVSYHPGLRPFLVLQDGSDLHVLDVENRRRISHGKDGWQDDGFPPRTDLREAQLGAAASILRSSADENLGYFDDGNPGPVVRGQGRRQLDSLIEVTDELLGQPPGRDTMLHASHHTLVAADLLLLGEREPAVALLERTLRYQSLVLGREDPGVRGNTRILETIRNEAPAPVVLRPGRKPREVVPLTSVTREPLEPRRPLIGRGTLRWDNGFRS